MNPSDKSINTLLTEFQSTEKFSASAWKNRGLLPSNHELCERLEIFFNSLAHELLRLNLAHSPLETIQSTLEQGLQSLDPLDFDTEEFEFIGDEFTRLSGIFRIDVSTKLDVWYYGKELVEALTLKTNLTSKPPTRLLMQPCTDCSDDLKTLITRESKGNIDDTWIIAKCLACGEYNFLTIPPGVGAMEPVGYSYIELLISKNYTSVQARNRFDQLNNKRRK